MDDAITYFLGYCSRVNAQIEMLIQFRLVDLPDIRASLGDPYFDQMTDATHGRWLRQIAAAKVDDQLGERLQTVLFESMALRNQIAHAPINLHVELPIRISSAKWLNVDPPSEEAVQKQQLRLEWVESWTIWLITQFAEARQWNGTWEVEYKPDQPRITPPV